MAAAEVLQTITLAAHQQCAIIEANSMLDWERICSVNRKVIAISQYPSPEFTTYIEDSGIPTILVVDSPLQSVAYLVGERQSDAIAVRAISASFSCLARKFTQNESETQSSNSRNLTEFLIRLAKIGGIEVSEAELDRVELQAIELASRFYGLAKHGVGISPQMNGACALAEVVLPRWGDLQRSGCGARVEWPASTFFLGDLPDTPMWEPVDLAGPARCILYGPYLHLPSGQWKASMKVGLAGYDGGQSFMVEVVCREVIAKGRFRCDGVGLFEIQVDFVHLSPHVPIELRLFLDAGAIYGSLSCFEVSLKASNIAALGI
jgi:hypothetical protein